MDAKKDIEVLHRLPTAMLIMELHNKGVTVEEVFNIYFQLEAMGDARDEEIFGNDEDGLHGRNLTVGDAQLAGIGDNITINRRPF